MSGFVLCPECRRKLKVPETLGTKSFRCPGCKTIIPAASLARLPENGSEDDEQDTPSPLRRVQPTPSAHPEAVSSRNRPPREEEPEEDIGPEEERLGREKASRKRRPIRKKSSKGLMIGLVAGCAVLMLLVLGAGGGAVWYFLRAKTIPASEWQSFSPPNSGSTVLMPGTPVPKTLPVPGVAVTQYMVERKKDNAAFAMAFFDLPPQNLQPDILVKIANGSRDGVLANMNGGTVTSETSISLGNLPGREYRIRSPIRGGYIGRVYLAKMGGSHRVYVLIAGGDSIQANTGDAARFFDSFKIDASAAPPTFDGAVGEGGAQPPPAINPPPGNRQPQPPAPNPGRRPPRGPRNPT